MQVWLARLSCYCFCLRLALAVSPQSLALDDYVEAQTKSALSGILANTFGANSSYPGVVIASPATDTAKAGQTGGQNYYYQWTRDASLTIKTLINQYASGDQSLEPFIKAYIANERNLQRLSTLSGNFTTGGLAEPKYYVNSTAFNEPWGRPQRDGPALRAVAIMGFLTLLDEEVYVKNVTETVVKPDLDYIAANWHQPGYDIWEEQNGLHFFTSMAHARALRDGVSFMANTGYQSEADAYQVEAAKISRLLDSYWNATAGTFDASLESTKPTGTDCANLLAVIHNTGVGAQYMPSSDKTLASASALIDEMTGLYPIDAKHNFDAISVGRYPSDIYDGIQTSQGNPWFLCTSAMAETVYLAATELLASGQIDVNSVNRGFYNKIQPSLKSGVNYTGAELTSITKNMRNYADQFLQIQQQHVGQNFSMAEEFNKDTGLEQGARDLTWSYAAFISAARARAGQLTYNFTMGNAANLPTSTTEPNATLQGTNITVSLSASSASLNVVSTALALASWLVCIL